MKYRASFNKYLSQLAPMDSRPFYCGLCNKIKKVVVIPCFAESRYILKTLYSLSKNDNDDLKDSLILCVVNNRRKTITDPESLADNQMTMAYLDMLIKGKMDDHPSAKMEHIDLLTNILKTNLRISYVDASSAGFELPDKGGGVGMARKIGLDKAISLFDNSENDIGLLYCLDADTVVENNYLTAVKLFFTQEQSTAAHVAFAHQDAEEESLQAAINCYEIFLRYYVAGLKYAGSPYAFHTIGSTIICTADSYAAVRGMNKRQAGEDFYFLNKLAKLDGVRSIRSTTVYPSARSSTRVPFGTGKAIMKYGKVNEHNYFVYNPTVFIILKEWLNLALDSWDQDAEVLMKETEKIHPLLRLFLHINQFTNIWQKLHTNCTNSTIFRSQFNRWFDGFKTLKLINHLTKNGVSPVNIFDAVHHLLNMLDKGFLKDGDSYIYQKTIEQKRLLNFLRTEVNP